MFHAVYSWRTGPRAKRASSGTDAFGIPMPTTKGSLLERLVDQRRYMSDLRNVYTTWDKQTSGSNVNRTSRTDSGHYFSSLKSYWTPAIWDISYDQTYNGKRGFYTGVAIVSPDQLPWDGNSHSWKKFSVSKPVAMTSSAIVKQTSDIFASSAPDKQEANLLTTAIELLRGDLPSVIKNFRNMVEKQQSIQKWIGAEHLNIQFGWRPLISEAAGVINTMATLDRALYYESFRRKRNWSGLSYHTSDLYTQICNTMGPSLNTPGSSGVESSGRQSAGIGFPVYGTRDIDFRQDFRFSARYSGLARPSRAAEYHTERAIDVVERLGFVNDPKAIWELMPYSWLLDWCANIGTGMVNAATYSAQTGRYDVDYAYVNSRTTHEISWLNSPKALHSVYAGTSCRQGRASLLTVSNRRTQGNPFGFGVDLTGLTSSQFSILTALGLARSR